MLTRALNCDPGLPPLATGPSRGRSAAVAFYLRTPTSISATAASPAPKLSPTRCRGGEQDPLPPFTLPRAVALASARRRQPCRPLAVRAAVAAIAASLSPYLSSPRSQLRVGQNRAENRAPELENERTPASLRRAAAARRREPPRAGRLPAGLTRVRPGTSDRRGRPRSKGGHTPLDRSTVDW
jgi:hypothetical protein